MQNIFKLAITLLLVPVAHADWRCDCTQITASCTAEVTVEGSGILVKSNSKQCSRVDYFVEGQPFVTVAVDGEAKEAWLPRTGESEVLIQSCQVCQDDLENPGAVRTSAIEEPPLLDDQPETASDQYDPIIAFDPVYPQDARVRGQQGYVRVKVIIDPLGGVKTVVVLEANPPRIFDAAATEAVRRWRYPARAPESADVEREESVLFQLGRTAYTDRNRGATTEQDAFRFNQCIRSASQGKVDDRFEVQLENVCEEPLVVHSCVEGSREAIGRWTCGSRNRQGTLLVPTGDQRAGRSVSVHADYGVQLFSYAERQSLYPFGNTRYWWVACEFRDRTCNDAAKRWRDAYQERPIDLSPGDTSLADVYSAR